MISQTGISNEFGEALLASFLPTANANAEADGMYLLEPGGQDYVGENSYDGQGPSAQISGMTFTGGVSRQEMR